MEDILSNQLIFTVRDQFQLDWNGSHGVRHWARVLDNGLYLAEIMEANTNVVKLFALFHDSQRHNDSWDPEHGYRGARLAESLRGNLFYLPDEEFNLLFIACSLHTKVKTHTDKTIQTCFDADRLDLGRIGKNPDPKFLCTPAARVSKTIEWATQRSTSNFVPDNILGRSLSTQQVLTRN